MKDILGGVCAPIGFSANGIHAGMRKNKSKKDLSLIVSEELCTAAATYTQNKEKGIIFKLYFSQNETRLEQS